MNKEQLKKQIDYLWENRDEIQTKENKTTIAQVVELLDSGEIRVAEPTENGWTINEWVKKAVVLYFPTREMETIDVNPFEFHDKIPLKTGYKEK